MNISIIIPVIRPEKATRCFSAIRADHGGDFLEVSEVSVFTGRKFLLANMDTMSEIEILLMEDTNGIGCPRMVAKLTAMARGEHILFLGDDTIPQPGFLQAALEAMGTLPDGWGVVGLADGTGRELPTHWLASKKMLPLLGGEFFHTGYTHCFCDYELWDRAKELGRFVHCPGAMVEHDHPLLKGEEVEDADLKRIYAPEVFNRDKRLFFARKANGWTTPPADEIRVAVGIPLVEGTLPVQFFTSFVCMDKPGDIKLLLPKFPHGSFAGNIADARNSLVEQAIQHGCTHLLMLDSDQIYPADTLTRLLAHDIDICGVRVHRRWPPFDVILLRGEPDSYVHVSDEECFSGDLVEVDATGTGCLLFKMSVFDKVPYPWFRLTETPAGKPIGEDIYFCSMARKAGARIAVDTGVEVGHMSTHIVGRGTYEIFKRINASRPEGQE